MKHWISSTAGVLRDAVEAGRIKRKDPTSSSPKFAEYILYWV
jgi:hypothetical protein